jgi:hypothetical protein
MDMMEIENGRVGDFEEFLSILGTVPKDNVKILYLH